MTVRKYYAICMLCLAKKKFDDVPKHAPTCERCDRLIDVKRTGGPTDPPKSSIAEVPVS